VTQDEAREHNNGVPGQVFRVFLRRDEEPRFRCYLCAGEGGWKNAKDALATSNVIILALGLAVIAG